MREKVGAREIILMLAKENFGPPEHLQYVLVHPQFVWKTRQGQRRNGIDVAETGLVDALEMLRVEGVRLRKRELSQVN